MNYEEAIRAHAFSDVLVSMVEKGARQMSGIPCAECGKFIAYADMDSGAAKHEFEPLSEFGPEVSEWVCPRCANKQSKRDGGTPKKLPPSNK